MNKKSDEFIENLPKYADEYIMECLNKTKEIATGSGKIVAVKERQLPTIAYFLNIWLPFFKGEEFSRRSYYMWLQSTDEAKLHTIKSIDDKFTALATDIVANEGKGIFYAKNKLGMTDKVQSDNTNIESITIKYEQ
jgi:hypothetical protein